MSVQRIGTALTLAALTVGLPLAGRSQEGAGQGRAGYASLDDLNAAYAKKLRDLDRQRIADLAALAGSKAGEEAARAYRELFHIAVSRELYVEAEPAAQQYLKTQPADSEDRALAAIVSLTAKAERGKYDESLADLEGFIKRHGVPADPNKRLDTNTVIAVGEAYLQRLIRAGRYDIARKVCQLGVANHPDPAVKGHFATRLARLNMVGKKAAPIVGRNVDGKPVRLADTKGKVVLVNFWATWCPPCVAAIPELHELQDKYRDKGFTVLGVNLDAHRDNVATAQKALPIVRRFLLEMRVDWPNVLAEEGPNDPAKAYGVTDIPSRFLVGRDGTILGVEQSGEALDKSIAAAVGQGAAGR